MRCFRFLPSLLLVLATPAAVGAETIIYFVGHPMEVPAPIVLLVCGLALIALGVLIRRWRERAEEPSRFDEPPLNQVVPPTMIVGSPVSDAANNVTAAETRPIE